jgi:glucose/arabinose dehydrogenase
MSPFIHVPSGFKGDMIANFGARELAFLPNGDLLAGTRAQSIVIIPNAEGAVPGKQHDFVRLDDQNADGVAFGPDGNIYVGTMHHLWKIPYTTGEQNVPASSAQIIATYRQGGIPAGANDAHDDSSVAISGNTIYVGVGSSCDKCTEIDPTRATIQSLSLGAPGPMTMVAKRIRNPLAMTVNPATGVLWAGGPGQDGLPKGHPYEYIDPVTLHNAPADYGWPACEENSNPFTSGANCTGTVAPILETFAYSTHIGAAFYPLNQGGAFAFPQAYRGGLFVGSHGSWHCCPSSIPKVEFFAMHGDTPAIPVTWTDPSTQWSAFMYDTRTSTASADYFERFTGVAVGPQGSLFVGDDHTPGIFRIRP